jgi:predicted transcriptional regulator
LRDARVGELEIDGDFPLVVAPNADAAGRVAAGWTQRELARRAGIRFEHLSRIESGKHVPSVPTIDKIDRALRRAKKRSGKKGK